jgi:membrane protease YdiL (CAAX protease family)
MGLIILVYLAGHADDGVGHHRSGTFLGWLTIRTGNVWPAVIGHAAINGISGLAVFTLQGKPNPLLGPFPTGIIGSAA